MSQYIQTLAVLDQSRTSYIESAARSHDRDVARYAERRTAGYKIAILTALPKETAAVEEVFGASLRLPSPEKCAIEFRSIQCPTLDGVGAHKILLCQSLAMGNNSAAVAAATTLSLFETVEDVILVGIAGGIPNVSAAKQKIKCDDHVRKGDVVVSERVVQYDMIKLEEKILNRIDRWHLARRRALEAR